MIMFWSIRMLKIKFWSRYWKNPKLYFQRFILMFMISPSELFQIYRNEKCSLAPSSEILRLARWCRHGSKRLHGRRFKKICFHGLSSEIHWFVLTLVKVWVSTSYSCYQLSLFISSSPRKTVFGFYSPKKTQLLKRV